MLDRSSPPSCNVSAIPPQRSMPVGSTRKGRYGMESGRVSRSAMGSGLLRAAHMREAPHPGSSRTRSPSNCWTPPRWRNWRPRWPRGRPKSAAHLGSPRPLTITPTGWPGRCGGDAIRHAPGPATTADKPPGPMKITGASRLSGEVLLLRPGQRWRPPEVVTDAAANWTLLRSRCTTRMVPPRDPWPQKGCR